MTANILGKVFLVGAGPGDPELLTLKGRRCLEEADVILYDRLVNAELMDHVARDAELIYVGKQVGKRCAKQRDIEELLIRRARDGKKVVRLKGGDPFVFGRGGEEAQALNRAGIPYEIVPGVSSAIAAPAYAGIPVTHRCCASSFAVVTGRQSSVGTTKVDWHALARGVDTLVIMMGVQNLGEIMNHLLNGGCEVERPAAIVESGTRPSQRTVFGTVGTIARLAEKYRMGSPAVIVVGEVVRLSEKIRWYEKRLCGELIPSTPLGDESGATPFSSWHPSTFCDDCSITGHRTD